MAATKFQQLMAEEMDKKNQRWQGMSEEDISTLSTSDLKQYIVMRGLRHGDCVEKGDLIKRAHEAQSKIRGQTTFVKEAINDHDELDDEDDDLDMFL